MYNCISGWNRSGTSALMLALKQAGIPILGFKYPVIFTAIDENKKEIAIDGGILIPSKDKEEANPTGFWEVSSITLQRGLQKKHQGFGMDGDLVKVMLNALPLSNPKMINKVVIITRDPRMVINSQIKANCVKNVEGWTRIASLGLIHNMVASLKWLNYYKKEYIFVQYEDLIKNPGNVLSDICDFLERGDYLWGEKAINRKLNRQKPVEYECKELKELEGFYKNYKSAYRKYDLDNIQERMDKMNKKYKVKIEKIS